MSLPARSLRLSLALAAALPALLSGCHKADGTAAAPASGSLTGSPVAAVPPPAGKSWSDIVATTPEDGMRMGNPAAPIRLVEYGSLSCPHCAHFAETAMKPLVEKYVDSGKVSYEYRSFAIHSIDVPLTVLARCAAPDAFFGLVEQLYANQPALIQRAEQGQNAANAAAGLSPDKRFVAISDAMGFTDFFSARGVSVDQAHACLANSASAERVARDAQSYGDQGIDSTPTLLVNGNHTQAATWEELEPILQKAGAR
ncbi:MAG: thioredoxin domain-containing protein [Sphingomonadales bacterium]|nr:thioredoxin domain-containing protein [Sphingomonadales bacterium]